MKHYFPFSDANIGTKILEKEFFVLIYVKIAGKS